eukprot:CAMPEP_0171592018 /NCGR_PEP_ID=MMETSP0961-20121227/16589_1 /TAXON_ID=87120 /ORGANISM="Aurantiochytrium limacinum, Strain ATCCMYA-1381" /LENGTH=40 /DNA_ID= /DNA_START= /DNA_END= /DNA_ORIENTATION=
MSSREVPVTFGGGGGMGASPCLKRRFLARFDPPLPESLRE